MTLSNRPRSLDQVHSDLGNLSNLLSLGVSTVIDISRAGDDADEITQVESVLIIASNIAEQAVHDIDFNYAKLRYPSGPTWADRPDPLLAQIKAFEAARTAFDVMVMDVEDDEKLEAARLATFGPILASIETCPERPVTVAGAFAGLQFVIEEAGKIELEEGHIAILQSCTALLREGMGL